jgi:hypothetical protein
MKRKAFTQFVRMYLKNCIITESTLYNVKGSSKSLKLHLMDDIWGAKNKNLGRVIDFIAYCAKNCQQTVNCKNIRTYHTSMEELSKAKGLIFKAHKSDLFTDTEKMLINKYIQLNAPTIRELKENKESGDKQKLQYLENSVHKTLLYRKVIKPLAGKRKLAIIQTLTRSEKNKRKAIPTKDLISRCVNSEEMSVFNPLHVLPLFGINSYNVRSLIKDKQEMDHVIQAGTNVIAKLETQNVLDGSGCESFLQEFKLFATNMAAEEHF